jgi:Ca2+-binding RTX toxin-like protein
MSQENYAKRGNHHYFTGDDVVTLGILTDDPNPSPIALDADTGVLTIVGTASADLIDVTERAPTVNAVRAGFGRAFDSADVKRVSVVAGAGDDRVSLLIQSIAGDVSGGDGSDHVAGGDRNDTLCGNAGRDFIDGGLGADRIVGNGGNDQLRGQGGADHVYGRDGNDRVEGDGGNDLLDGGNGADTLSGGAGEDWLVSADETLDELFGDGGRDTADADQDDMLASIESTA